MNPFSEVRAAPADPDRRSLSSDFAAAPQLPLALFDEIECGLIVCDDQGVIHFANQAARQELFSQRLLLQVLGRRQPCSALGLETLAGSYGLTLAERRVLGALVREATPRDIARQHAVALSTVRTQISSIRAKFGTRSIEGLLLRAAEVPPVASALRLAASTAPPPMLAAA